MYRLARTALLILCTALVSATPAIADVVGDWNQTILATVGVAAPAGRGATPATIIDVAMTHLAMHDAAQAYDKRFEPYAGSIAGASGSGIVAVARAAYEVLADRFPLQAAGLLTTYNNYVAALIPAPSPADRAAGEAVGHQAAQNVITARAGDGSFPTTFDQFTGGTGPGEWRPNPGTPGMVAPWAGAVRQFALDSVQRCQPDAIPPLTSIEYAENYNEVKALGSATNSTRTPAQGRIARVFSGNFFGIYNRLFQELAAAHLAGNSAAKLGDRARLFALTNTAMADAFICAWESKKKFNFWRPIHAIQNGDQDGNLLTEKDASWTPYFLPITPNYPDYTSGANNVTGASMRMLQLYFGGDRPFESFQIFAAPIPGGLVPEAGDSPITYDRFSDVMKDVIVARIYLGIHFRFADTEARSQGRRVANYAFKNILQPIDKHGNK